jgi:hypothetical protein
MKPVPPSDPSITLDPYDQAWQRLISGVVPQDELAFLIDTIFSNEKVANMVDGLQGNDIQTFIDVIDTVWHHVLPSRRSISTFYILLVRRWSASISSHASDGNP